MIRVVVVGDGVVVVGDRVVVGSDEVVAVVGGVGDGQWVGEVAIVGNVVFLVSSFLRAVLVVVGGLVVVIGCTCHLCCGCVGCGGAVGWTVVVVV